MRGPVLEPGTVLADKYQLDSRLGEGGMGTVYRATHLLLRAPVAIKVIDREVSEGDVALSRFMREAQAAASLRSPHVVQVLDYGTDNGRPFMVMELLEGESLAQRIERLGSLTPLETYRVMSHVARAVAKAHEAGIIHRDLKPDNVFLVHNEGDEVAKVLDFGVAKVEATALGEGSHTRTGSLLGTPYYMSPEQAQGNKTVDLRSDLWALGVIAFECMTGRRPFFSDGLGEIVLQICIRDIPRPSQFAAVPPGFDEWFARATERDPIARFQSARELSEALRLALEVDRELGTAIPEAAWSTAAALPRSLAGTPHSSVVADATTEKDPESAPLKTLDSSSGQPSPGLSENLADPAAESSPPLLGHREIHRTEGQGGARWEESVDPPSVAPPGIEAGPDSQWEIVPHGEQEAPPEGPRPRNAALELVLAEEKTGSGSLLLVGLVAVILGAAGVLIFRSFNAQPLPLPGRSSTSAPSIITEPERRSSGQSGAATPDSASSDAATPDGPAAQRPDQEAVPQERAPGEGEILDAIDAAAAAQAAQNAGDEAGEEQPRSGEGKTGTAKDATSKTKDEKSQEKAGASTGGTAGTGTEPTTPPERGSKDTKDAGAKGSKDGAGKDTASGGSASTPQPVVPERLGPIPPPPPATEP